VLRNRDRLRWLIDAQCSADRQTQGSQFWGIDQPFNADWRQLLPSIALATRVGAPWLVQLIADQVPDDPVDAIWRGRSSRNGRSPPVARHERRMHGPADRVWRFRVQPVDARPFDREFRPEPRYVRCHEGGSEGRIATPANLLWAIENNNFPARQIGWHPEQLAGFASLPMHSPQSDRRVDASRDELGFKGALVHGRYYDDRA
jgi:hypothetical protein